jgi:hypothetical protein
LVGLLSDSHGDLDAFDRAFELLREKGARRFIFAGGRYADLDEWVLLRRSRARGGRSYTDEDFLADVSNFLGSRDPVERPPAFSEEPAERAEAPEEDLEKVFSRFLRVPDKESLQYLEARVPNKAVDMIGDQLCCVVHDKNDLTRDDLLNAQVFVHGREGEPKVVQIGPRFFVTPGRLAGAAEQTCGLFERVERSLCFTALRLDGQVLVHRQPLAVERRTRLSVK